MPNINDERVVEPIFHGEHAPGCPARFGDGGCDEEQDVVAARRHEAAETRSFALAETTGYFTAVPINSDSIYVLTSKGLEALGFPALAAEQRRQARARLEARGFIEVEEIGGTKHRIPDHDTGNDSPAGAGHDVEADRG
jgi:hypothetical protein